MSQVHLCGSFTRWVETVPMACDEASPGLFAVVVHLPPGCVPVLRFTLVYTQRSQSARRQAVHCTL